MSREKQIDDIRKIIVNCDNVPSNVCRFKPCSLCKAERLYNAGYRKQEEGEWIRAENPPEEYRDECGELIPFLVCCQGTVYPFRAMYDGANWGDGIGVLKVTHWMPLPEPPKES